MLCKNCNAENADNQVFCGNCGVALATDGQVQENPKENSEIPQGNSGIPQGNNSAIPQGNTIPQNSVPQNNMNGAVPQGGQNYSGSNSSASGTDAKSFFLKLWDYYKELWLKYINFDGRISVNKFWLTVLANFLATIALNIVLKIVPIPYIGSLYSLATFIPLLGLEVRRLHDIGKNWTRLFIALIPIAGPIMLIVDYTKKGNVCANEFGPVPEE